MSPPSTRVSECFERRHQKERFCPFCGFPYSGIGSNRFCVECGGNLTDIMRSLSLVWYPLGDILPPNRPDITVALNSIGIGSLDDLSSMTYGERMNLVALGLTNEETVYLRDRAMVESAKRTERIEREKRGRGKILKLERERAKRKPKVITKRPENHYTPTRKANSGVPLWQKLPIGLFFGFLFTISAIKLIIWPVFRLFAYSDTNLWGWVQYISSMVIMIASFMCAIHCSDRDVFRFTLFLSGFAPFHLVGYFFGLDVLKVLLLSIFSGIHMRLLDGYGSLFRKAIRYVFVVYIIPIMLMFAWCELGVVYFSPHPTEQRVFEILLSFRSNLRQIFVLGADSIGEMALVLIILAFLGLLAQYIRLCTY